MGGDLASYIASRRRARGASEASGSPDGAQTESDTARRERIVASNLASVNTPTFNDGPKNSGGVFQILRIGYDDAEFAFFGWNREIKRRANMRIEVRRTTGDADIRHATRKMMAIIREYDRGLHVGVGAARRNIRLSARQRQCRSRASDAGVFTGAQARWAVSARRGDARILVFLTIRRRAAAEHPRAHSSLARAFVLRPEMSPGRH
jgi:hypothetical protein